MVQANPMQIIPELRMETVMQAVVRGAAEAAWGATAAAEAASSTGAVCGLGGRGQEEAVARVKAKSRR
jgi:hypothetical protein